MAATVSRTAAAPGNFDLGQRLKGEEKFKKKGGGRKRRQKLNSVQ